MSAWRKASVVVVWWGTHVGDGKELAVVVGLMGPLETACRRLQAGQAVALATVVTTWGSAPVPVGAQMVVIGETDFQGSVSGGCVENEVILTALEVLSNGIPAQLDFGVEHETAWSVGLPCGGQISVFVERLTPDGDADLVAALGDAIAQRRVVGWQTSLSSGRRSFTIGTSAARVPDGSTAVMATGPVGFSQADGEDVFRYDVRPAPRLLVVGATHTAQVLAQLAMATGYSCAIIDPREAYANPSRFPQDQFAGVELLQEWPEDALPRLGLEPFTGVAVLAHVADIDDPALKCVVGSPVSYIGALGSHRNHAKRRTRLLSQGMSAEDFERIRCPIGLDIGAATPAEIALSVMAEFVLVTRGAKRAAKVV
ncbi:MAG: XdhC family protein [Pseudomonadota bacterium]